MWSQMQHDGWETVNVYVKEKKKWKKYPCAVRGNSFVQFKDNNVRVWKLPEGLHSGAMVLYCYYNMLYFCIITAYHFCRIHHHCH